MARIGSSDLDVFPLALGGNVFGWTADERESFAVLDAYRAAGGNFIDTADVYSIWAEGNPGGTSETVLGNWMASRGNRDELVIATKVGAHPDFKGLRAGTIKSAVEHSLRRLRTDRIDLYYTHYDDPDTPVDGRPGYGDVTDAVYRLVEDTWLDNWSAEKYVGTIFRDAQEAALVDAAVLRVLRILHDVGADAPVRAYLDHPAWPDAVRAAREAHALLAGNDGDDPDAPPRSLDVLAIYTRTR